jgi:hypothetical protein
MRKRDYSTHCTSWLTNPSLLDGEARALLGRGAFSRRCGFGRVADEQALCWISFVFGEIAA